MEPIQPTASSALLTELHRELEAACCDLRAADPLALIALYRRFEASLLAHFETEEQLLLPVYAETFPATARQLREEHADLRRLLRHAAIDVDLHVARAEQLDRLVERLRSHAGFEEATLYRWADQHLDSRELAEVADRLAAHGSTSSAAPRTGGSQLEHTGFSR